MWRVGGAAAVGGAWAVSAYQRNWGAPQPPKKQKDREEKAPVPRRVVLFGPPLSGKTTLVGRMRGPDGKELVHFRPGEFFAENREAGTPLGKRLDAFYRDEKAQRHEIPGTDVFLKEVSAHLNGLSAAGQGYVLEKGPRETGHFAAWHASREKGGIGQPTHVVVLRVDPEVVVKRAAGRRIDPVTGKSYNTEGHMPADPAILARLVTRGEDLTVDSVKYRLELFERVRRPVIDMYDRRLMREFSTSGTPDEIAAAVNEFLATDTERSEL
jgi:adenylate kinase family enzyme